MLKKLREDCEKVNIKYESILYLLLLSLSLSFILYFTSNNALYLVVGLLISLGVFNYPNFIYKRKLSESKTTSPFFVLLSLILYESTKNLEWSIRKAQNSLRGTLREIFEAISREYSYNPTKTLQEVFREKKERIEEVDPSLWEFLQSLLGFSKRPKEMKAMYMAGNEYFEGIKNSLQNSAENLINPTKAIFTFLILAPVLVMAIIPISLAFMPELLSWDSLFLIFDVLIPSSIVIFAIWITTERPFSTLKYSEIPFSISISILSPLLVLTTIPFFPDVFVPLIVGIAFFILSYLLDSKLKGVRERIESLKVREKEIIAFLREFINNLNFHSSPESAAMEVKRSPIANKLKEKIREGISFNNVIKSEEFKSYLGNEFLHSLLNSLSETLKYGKDAFTKATTTSLKFLEKIKEINDRFRLLLEETVLTGEMTVKYITPLVVGVSLAFTTTTIEYAKSLELSNLLSGKEDLKLLFFSLSLYPFLLSISSSYLIGEILGEGMVNVLDRAKGYIKITSITLILSYIASLGILNAMLP